MYSVLLLPCFHLSFLSLPSSEELQHVQKLRSRPVVETEQQVPLSRNPPPILICNGLPPVPARLIKRVEDGMYIEMAELLPDHLSSVELNMSEQPSSTRSKLHEVTNIMDWIECFGMYIAIISRSAPHRVADHQIPKLDHICFSKST